MFYVYQITFNDGLYIGCTNNLQRRKDQHNGNAKTGKSKLGTYLNEHGITLETSDLVVLHEYNNRDTALRVEREIAIGLDKSGVKLLNDNYSHDCTRQGKNTGMTVKEYYVVDFKNHTVVPVCDLRQYCLSNGLAYKTIQRTTKGMRYSMSGHKAFYKADWESETDKDRFISGRFVDDRNNEMSALKSEKYAKEYEVLFPDGHTEIVRNLDRFAMDHSLTPGTLHATIFKGKPTKGYQVLRRV